MVKSIALLVSLTLMGLVAQAQVRYTCRFGGGYYQSAQPCPGGSDNSTGNNTSNGSVGLVYRAPVTPPSRYETAQARIAEAPATLRYLSPRCASLSDAIRTAPARGLKYDTINELHREYRRECAEDENEAQQRLSQERREQSQQQREAKAASQAEQERAKIKAQQCGESKRILLTKRARTDLTEGEKADLKRFEENYLARCG